MAKEMTARFEGKQASWWGLVNVIRLDKGKGGLGPKDFRPISVINTLEKVYEGVLANLAIQALKSIQENQFGFMPGRQ
eukprot:14883496-Alexandrium_andersonii.AAC.1